MLQRIFLILVICSLAGCIPLEPVTPEPTEPVLPEPPTILAVSAKSSTEILVNFSKAMSDSALNPGAYTISWGEGSDQSLGIDAVQWEQEHSTVKLVTQPQSAISYQLEVIGVEDQEGNTLDAGDHALVFTGIADERVLDRDKDGLTDRQEAIGWDVQCEAAEGMVRLHVTSDPEIADTDGDKLLDREEMIFATDPGNPDTDGDGLSDYDEARRYFSHPCNRDSDGDGLDDGTETNHYKTSPAMVDTDGDGLSDTEELLTGGRNPLLADLPKISLNLYGNPVIELNVQIEQRTETHSQELVSNEEEKVKTDTTANKISIENTVKLHTESEAGTSNWPPSFNAKLTTDTEFHQGYFHDTSSSWKNTSVQQSQQNYETWGLETVQYAGGKLSVAMKIVNQSDLSFKIKDLQILAYRLVGGSKLGLIGVLSPDRENWPEGGQTLEPGGEFIMTFTRQDIGGEIMRELVRNPSGILFEAGSYELYRLDKTGQVETANYAMMGETVVERTGVLVIDDGMGTVSHYMVATNLERDEHGAGVGVRMDEILREIIGMDYETCESVPPEGNTPSDLQVLCRINTVENFRCDGRIPDKPTTLGITQALCPPGGTNTDIRGFWLVGGTGTQFEPEKNVNFDELVLKNGERIYLVFLQDSDGDRIFDREEYLLGTDKLNTDTDGDGLTDYEEAKIGWTVSPQGQEPYQVFSDPRFYDLDNDFLSDVTEFSHLTDPYLRDTDGDGKLDSTDSDPLRPPCMDGPALGLTGWWNGTIQGNQAIDACSEGCDEVANDGTIVGKGISYTFQGNPVFIFDPSDPKNIHYITIPQAVNLSPYHEYTLAARIFWEQDTHGPEAGTILTKGPSTSANYSLITNRDGTLSHSLHRRMNITNEQCYHDTILGIRWCDGGSVKDDGPRNSLETQAPDLQIGNQSWVYVVATFRGEEMKLYIDGELVDTKEFDSSSTYGRFGYFYKKKNYSTLHLVENQDTLWIGATPGESDVIWPFSGMLDDVQFFERALSEDEVFLISQLGVCSYGP